MSGSPVSHLRFRVHDLDIVVPSRAVVRLSSASLLLPKDTSPDTLDLAGETYRLVDLRRRLGFPAAEVGPWTGLAFLAEGDARWVIQIDSFTGLVSFDEAPAFCFPELFWKARPDLAFSRLHVIAGSLFPELSPGRLGSQEGAEPDPTSQALATSPATPDFERPHLTFRTFLGEAALPMADVAQVVDPGALMSFPGLPQGVSGFFLFRGAPLPVLSLASPSDPGRGVALGETPGAPGTALVVATLNAHYALRVDAVDRPRRLSPAEAERPTPRQPPPGLAGLGIDPEGAEAREIAVLDAQALYQEMLSQ